MNSPLTPQQLAEATRDAMWHGNRASGSLGMQVLAIGPDKCRAVDDGAR